MSRLSRRTMLTTLAVAPVAMGAVAQSVSSGSDTKVFTTSESAREKLQKRYFPNFELTTHEGEIRPKITHTFEADGDDRTIYARRVRFETGGVLKVLEPLMKRMPRNPNTRTAENLKLVLEGSEPR